MNSLSAVLCGVALAAVLDNHGLAMSEASTNDSAVIRLQSPAVASSETNGSGYSESSIIPLLVMEDVRLIDAIKNLARVAKVNYLLDSRVPGSGIGPGRRLREPVVTARWENVTARQALDDVLKSNKLVLVPDPATTIARIVPASVTVKPAPPGWISADTNGVIPLVVTDEAQLAKLLTMLGSAAKLQVTLDGSVLSPPPALAGTVSLRWEDITARQGLAALADNFGLEMIEDPALSSIFIRVKAPEK